MPLLIHKITILNIYLNSHSHYYLVIILYTLVGLNIYKRLKNYNFALSELNFNVRHYFYNTLLIYKINIFKVVFNKRAGLVTHVTI